MKTYNEMLGYKVALLIGRLVKVSKVRKLCARTIVACIEKDAKACQERYNMTVYTIDLDSIAKVVSRKEFLKFVENNDCYGLVRTFGDDYEWFWDGALSVTDEKFDWEHYMDADCIEPQCIVEHLGQDGAKITEWNISRADGGYYIAKAVVGAWK